MSITRIWYDYVKYHSLYYSFRISIYPGVNIDYALYKFAYSTMNYSYRDYGYYKFTIRFIKEGYCPYLTSKNSKKQFMEWE